MCESSEAGTLGHQLYNCEGVLHPPEELPVESLSEEVLERRAYLRGRGDNGLGDPEWDSLELYGLPYHPIKLAPLPTQCPVFHWGATHLPW
eukprot:4274923-Pyramimonas_sp.AAC.1